MYVRGCPRSGHFQLPPFPIGNNKRSFQGPRIRGSEGWWGERVRAEFSPCAISPYESGGVDSVVGVLSNYC